MESTPHAYAVAYRQAQEEAEALVSTLSREQFNWKPSPEAWSVAECLMHLNQAHLPYVRALEARIAEGVPPGEPPFRYGWLARLFINATAPAMKRKLKTASAMNPNEGAAASDFEPDRVLADFKAHTDGFLDILGRTEGRDLSRIKISSPFLKLLRLPAGAFVEALAGHNLRHLAQARRVTAQPGFPA